MILAREKIVVPVFSSIEEFLGRNTRAYYDVLAEVGRGAWHPDRNSRPWLRFCLRAHYIQIQTVIRRLAEAEMLWLGCAAVAESHGLPERATAAMVDAAYGLRVRRSSYVAAVTDSMSEEITDITASRDLRALIDAGLLEAVGERRVRHYVAGPALHHLRERVRADRPSRTDVDPFKRVRSGRQLQFPS